MKKRILAVVLSIAMVLSFVPFTAFADGIATASTTEEIVFNLGANGSASHSDGSSKTSYSETQGDYKLSLTASAQFYTGARDAKGNSCVKLGSSSKVGGFSFTVPDDVTSVIIEAAKYKANTSKLSVNGTSYTLSNASNNGTYDVITVDTTSTKKVTVTTVSGGVRAMINTITYVIEVDDSGCEHDYKSSTTAPTCTTAGSTTYTCALCGDTYSETIDATGHSFVAGEVVAPTLESEGYTIYTCSACGATENRDFVDKLLPAGTTEVKFELGTDGSAAHKDGSSNKTTYSETVNGYTLSITDGTNMYPASLDAKGNGSIKLGTSSKTGGFSFTVPAEVTSVTIEIAKYKANTTKITVNDTEYTLTKNSDNGEYDKITVDTTSKKDITLTTVSGGVRAMVNAITFTIVAGECEHDYESVVTNAPTCTETGDVTHTCLLCGDSYTEKTDALGHDFVAGEVVAPNGIELGYTIYDCSRCEATENRDYTVAAPEGTEPVIFEFGENGNPAHSDGDAITAPKEYTSGDYTLNFTTLTKVYGGSFDAKGNSAIKLGTGSLTATLEFTVPNNVNAVVIKIAGYKANDAVFTVNGGEAQTVSLHSDDGLYMPIVIDTTENKTITLATTSKGYRALIDSITYYVSTACEHSYESVTTDPTCTEAGKTVYTCSKCGESYEETITATGHAYNSEVTAPTCTVGGYTTHTCANCGDVYKDNETEPAGHKYDAVVTEPTCTVGGYTTHTCSVCGDTYKDSETAPAGHKYDAVVTEPTCTTDGFTTYTCACGDSYIGNTVAASHKYDAVVTEPTCTDEGFTTYTCLVCGDSYTDNTVEALGHSYESVKVAPSATDTGYTKHTCSGCGDVSVSDPVLLYNGKVHNVAATSDGDTVTITWDALTAVNKYIAYIYAVDGTLVKCAQKTTNKIAFAGLELGDYVVLVIAKTSSGWSDYLYADEVPFTIAEKEPETEQGPSASAGEITPNYVTITWPAVEGATKYTVMISGNGETIYRAATTNSVKVYGLEPATSYEVSVNAKVDGKYTGYGEACTLTTAGNSNAILSIQTLSPDSVTLTWDAVENGDKYFIKLDTEEGTKYYSTTSTSITINGLSAEKTYSVAINTRTIGKNYSGYGSSISFTTPAPEGIVINSQIKADGVHLSWASGLAFDKVWVKEVLADGTEFQHAALDGESKFTVDGYVEGTREFFLIIRVQTLSGKKQYVTTDSIFVTAPALKEVEVATEEELKAALATAKVGEIVKIILTADITTTIADDASAIFTVAKGTDVVLDLNGKKITATLPDNAVSKAESVFYVGQDSTFAVRGNGTISATMGTNSSNLTTIFNNCGATLLLEDGSYSLTLEDGKKGFIADIVDNNSTLGETKTTILDGYFTTSNNIGNMFRNFANHKTESCSLIIEGGEFVSEFSSASYPKAVFWNQSPNANCYGTGYINIVRGSFSGLEVENEHPAENVTISKKAFIGIYGTTTYVDDAAELKAALANGGYIVLNGDIDLSAEEGAEITGNVITENTVLDLNGNTITYAAEYVSGMNGTQISAITVENGATLVIGNGSIDADSFYGIYAKNGNVVIVSGSYSAITSAVQVNAGKVEIKGGTFAGSETYLLNCIDSSYNNGNAQIVVTGGEFVGFNPADNAAEGTGTNFVEEGYTVNVENDKYIVVEA